MDHFAVYGVVEVEVRNLERADGFDGRRKSLVRLAKTLCTAQPLPGGPERAKNLCPVESLALAVVAECHPLHSTRPARRAQQAAQPARRGTGQGALEEAGGLQIDVVDM